MKLNDYNHKKILCKNITMNGKCLYTQKCLFAHSLDEQKIDNIRNDAYDIIKGTLDLSNVNLIKDTQLYNTLVSLTTVCELCIVGKCTGGYNCKHGACKKKYVICHTDLNKGTCFKCNNIHLTNRGLKPYCAQIIDNLKIKTKTNFKVMKINSDSDSDSGSNSDSNSDNSNNYDVSWSKLITGTDKKEITYSNNEINNKLHKSIFNI